MRVIVTNAVKEGDVDAPGDGIAVELGQAVTLDITDGEGNEPDLDSYQVGD